MNKTTPCICLLLLSSSVFADEHVYSSLQLGKASHDISVLDHNIFSDIKPLVGGINTAVLYGEDKLKIGYNVSISYLYDSNVENQTKVTMKSWGGDISPLISYHVTDNFNIYSKIGLSYTSTAYNVHIQDKEQKIDIEMEADDRSFGHTYGVGFNCKINENYFIGAEYKVNEFEFKEADIENEIFLLNIGVHI